MSGPRTLPVVDLTLDGAPVEPLTTRSLCEVRVRQALSLPAQCELLFRDPPGPLDLVSDVRPGARLEIAVHGGGLFQGEVTAVEHAFEADGERAVRVRAYDLSHRLRRRQTVRAHVGVSAASLAGELAREVGLTIDAAADAPRHPWLVQHHRSDLDLLVDALQRCGLYYTVRDGCMHLLTLQGMGEPLPLELGTTLLESRTELNAVGACGEVTVAGWDPVSGEAFVGRATRPGTGIPAAAVPGAEGRRSLCNQAMSGLAHADAVARAEMDAHSTGEVRFSGVAEGDVRLIPGARIAVAGPAGSLGGSHVLTDVTHTLDDHRGYVAALGTEPPRPLGRAESTAMTEAVVTQVHDPDGRGRVKARLPGYFDVETDWMPVVTLGAGSGKGLLVQPDVGDTVLVLLAHGDPAQGVVLGGLYGLRDVPDAAGVVGGSVRRYHLRTPGGQVVSLDDEGRSVTVQDAAGSAVHLAPEKVTLRSRADLDIDASGHRIVIRGRAIDFESA